MKPRAVDIACGLGGVTVGLVRAGYDVAGFDSDPTALALYRELGGIGAVVSAEAAHPPWMPLEAVWCDLPKTRPAAGPVAHHCVRIAVEGRAKSIVFLAGQGMTEPLERLLTSAGYFAATKTLERADYGTPQFGRVPVTVAFRKYRAMEKFTWPKPTHCRPERRLKGRVPWVAVGDVIPQLADYRDPCPRIGANDWNGSWRGMGGGRQRATRWRAGESVAMSYGRSVWMERMGRKSPCFTPEETLALQGFPVFGFEVTRATAYPLAERVTSPQIVEAVSARAKLVLHF